jgi:hypothetical protein
MPIHLLLVSVGVFQDYILTNIRQLIRLGHDSIYVITDAKFFGYFVDFVGRVHLIDAGELCDTYRFAEVCGLDKDFREGFWQATSSRFFYIYALMNRDDLRDVIHIENDVLLYYNCAILESRLDKTKMYLPFDSYSRSIASIVYIPTHYVLKCVLDLYMYEENDMYNFPIIRAQIPDKIDQFPIYRPLYSHTSEQNSVCINFELFNFIFDAAAIGQYLGGVDPRNCSGDTRGFINETCVIQYNKCSFLWFKGNDGITRPVAETEGGVRVPIFNLHIHCKRLDEFLPT